MSYRGPVAALALGALAVLIVLLSGGASYAVHARFSDAGQLVRGDLVTIAGHQVGSVGAIRLAGDGLADVELDISDSSITPLRRGTVATIGQLSLTGVANRFVDLHPGPGAPISDGGTLPVRQTHGIVDLDVVLDALTPRVRSSLRQILRTGAYFVRRPTVAKLNRLAVYLNPAFSQATRLGSELVADRFALERLVGETGGLARRLAAESASVGGAVSHTAAVLREVSSQRGALEDSLVRAPGVLAQSDAVLGHVDSALSVVDPMLSALVPVAPRLASLLRVTVPYASDLIPALNDIRGLFGPARRALNGFIPVAHRGVPAIGSLARALKLGLPITAGFRAYTPDAIAGFFNGVGGAQAAAYDANGHYLRSLVTLQGGGASLSGLLSVLGAAQLQLGTLGGARTGLLAPCPGGGGPSGSDASNPWTDPPAPAGSSPLCRPADDQRP